MADGGYDPVAQKQAYLDKANIVTDESLASTRRMVGLIEESKESAVGTMVQLDEQVIRGGGKILRVCTVQYGSN